MHAEIYGSYKNKSHDKFCFEDSEKIRLMTEGLIESPKQLTLWIIGFFDSTWSQCCFYHYYLYINDATVMIYFLSHVKIRIKSAVT